MSAASARPALAALASLLASASCSPPAPSSPGPGAAASAAASAAARPVLPEAIGSSGNQPGPSAGASPAPAFSGSSSLRPYRGALVGDDVATLFAARARLARKSPLRLRLDESEPALAAVEPFEIVPIERVVVDQREGWARLVHESDGYRLLVWASHQALERAPARLTRLALEPGVFPDPPGGGPAAGSTGVFVMPGQRLDPKARKGSWVSVELYDAGFHARGWVDESTFEPVWTPTPIDQPSGASGAGVSTGSRLLAWPGGPAIGDFPRSPGEGPSMVRGLVAVGDAPPGFVRLRFTGRTLIAEGLVARSSFVPPSGGLFGRGKMGRLLVSFRDPNVKPAFSLPPGTDLFDQPDGELVGRTTQKTWAPDRLAPRVEQGRRLIEVPAGQLGLIKVWVDEAALSPYAPEVKPEK